MALSGSQLIRLSPVSQVYLSVTAFSPSVRAANPQPLCALLFLVLVPHPARYPHLNPIRKSPARTADFIISASCQVEPYVTGSRVQRFVGRPEYIGLTNIVIWTNKCGI